MFAYTHILTYVRTHARTYVRTNLSAYVCASVCLWVCVCVCVCVFLCRFGLMSVVITYEQKNKQVFVMFNTRITQTRNASTSVRRVVSSRAHCVSSNRTLDTTWKRQTSCTREMLLSSVTLRKPLTAKWNDSRMSKRKSKWWIKGFSRFISRLIL